MSVTQKFKIEGKKPGKLHKNEDFSHFFFQFRYRNYADIEKVGKGWSL